MKIVNRDVITFRVSPQMFKLILADAEAKQLGMAEWGRQMVAEYFNESQQTQLLTQEIRASADRVAELILNKLGELVAE